MSQDQIGFKGIYSYGDDLYINKLEISIKYWLDWSFLRIGGWQNVEVPQVDLRGGDFSRLRLVDDPSYTDGTVWEGLRKDWVWDTTVDYDDGSTVNNPISPVIYVDGSPTAPDYIDYPNGRVYFSSAIPSSSTVQADYSYRLVQVYRSYNVPWLRRFQYDSQDSDNTYFDATTGEFSVDANKRIQLPAIVFGAVGRSNARGYQLGDGAFWAEQDVLCRVYAMDEPTRNHLVDILKNQFHNTIWLFDNNLAAENGDLPLDDRGEIVDNTKNYEYLIDPDNGYRWKKCRFLRADAASVESLSPYLFEGSVRLTCEAVLDD